MMIPIELLWTAGILALAGCLWMVARRVLPKVMVGDKVDMIAVRLKMHIEFSDAQSQKILDQNVLIARAIVANSKKLSAVLQGLDEVANGSYGMPPQRSQFGLTKEEVLGSAEVRREQLEAEGFQGEELDRKIEEEEKIFGELNQLLRIGGTR